MELATYKQGVSFSEIPTKPVIREAESFHDGYVFRLDYAPHTPDAVLQNDVITYLEEYRLQVKKSQYDLLYTRGNDGQLALRSSDNGDSMLAIGHNAVTDRALSGKPYEKEAADLIGMQQIQEYLTTAQEGETILWASPPDPAVGYEYGFFYIGQVNELKNGEKKLSLSAVRLDQNPSLGQFNQALSLLTQERIENRSVNEFIRKPLKLQRSVSEQELDFVLKGTFAFEEDPFEQERKMYVRERLQPLIDAFKQNVRYGASKDVLRKMIFALENYSLKLQSEYSKPTESSEMVLYESPRYQQASLTRLMDEYSFVPPRVVGSCDTGSNSSGPSILGYTSIFSGRSGEPTISGSEQKWSYSKGECRLCKNTYTDVGPCKICKTCEKKFN